MDDMHELKQSLQKAIAMVEGAINREAVIKDVLRRWVNGQPVTTKEAAFASLGDPVVATKAEPTSAATIGNGADRYVAEPKVPLHVIEAFERRYRVHSDLARDDHEWRNTWRYKHDGVQKRWEGWRDGYLAIFDTVFGLRPPGGM